MCTGAVANVALLNHAQKRGADSPIESPIQCDSPSPMNSKSPIDAKSSGKQAEKLFMLLDAVSHLTDQVNQLTCTDDVQQVASLQYVMAWAGTHSRMTVVSTQPQTKPNTGNQ